MNLRVENNNNNNHKRRHREESLRCRPAERTRKPSTPSILHSKCVQSQYSAAAEAKCHSVMLKR